MQVVVSYSEVSEGLSGKLLQSWHDIGICFYPYQLSYLDSLEWIANCSFVFLLSASYFYSARSMQQAVSLLSAKSVFKEGAIVFLEPEAEILFYNPSMLQNFWQEKWCFQLEAVKQQIHLQKASEMVSDLKLFRKFFENIRSYHQLAHTLPQYTYTEALTHPEQVVFSSVLL